VTRVLVVDDDGDVRDLVARWLRASGYEVLVADSGRTALAVVEEHGLPHLAVLDVDMDGMDGVALLDALRQRNAGMPALFLTVLWSGPDVARMREAGGVYMAKPFTAAKLRAAVRGLLEGGGRHDAGVR
jgi:DNA-binding response OmpR family regulator